MTSAREYLHGSVWSDNCGCGTCTRVLIGDKRRTGRFLLTVVVRFHGGLLWPGRSGKERDGLSARRQLPLVVPAGHFLIVPTQQRRDVVHQTRLFFQVPVNPALSLHFLREFLP